MVRENDLPEINGLIARRQWLIEIKQGKDKKKLNESDRAMLFFIRNRLEDLGVEGGTGSN